MLFSSVWAEGKTIRLEFGEPNSQSINLPLKKQLKRKKVGLALSGGGARGFTQIGILKVLEREQIPIDYIAGTSMGGVVGGLFAAGYSAEELEELVLKTNWEDILRDNPNRLSLFLSQREESEGYFLKIRFNGFRPYMPTALTSGQKITDLFTSLTAGANYRARANFDYLKIPFRAVATDLETGQKVVLGSGDLAEALRATISVPLAFAPVELDQKVLVDGGLVEPIPVETAKEMGAGIIIAVNTSTSLLSWKKITNPIDIADQTTSIMSLDEKERQLSQADLVISPELGGYSAVDFDKAKELIAIGERACDQVVSRIKQIVSEKDTLGQETYYLTEVEFDGAEQINKDTLERICPIQAGDSITLKSIEDYLREIYGSGYFSDAYAELEPYRSGYVLVFNLKENQILREILFSGNSIFSTSQLKKELSLELGQTLNSQRLERGLDNVLELYKQKGHALASISKVNFNSGALLIEINEGIISEIRVEGNHRTKNWVILRSFPLKVGKPFNSNLADKGVEDIYATELFDKVTLKILPGEKGAILDISIKEKDFTFLRIGMHYDDEHNLESALQLMDANILGIGNKTYADLLYGNTKQRYGLHFKADRIYKSYLTYRGDIFHQREKKKIYSEHREIDSFREWRTGTVFSLGQHISRLGTLSLETKLERVELREGKIYPKEVNDVRSITLRSLVDTFDKYPFPDRGKYHHLYIELAGRILKGDLTFRKGFTSLESYFPLSKHWNFHPKIALGISDGNLPTSEQFLLGGYNEFYGFFQDELRGDKLIYGNLEMRFKFWQRFYWNVRYDIGNVWSEPEDFKTNDIHHAIGTGLAIDTPLGPAQIHYGYAGKGIDKVYVRAGFEF